MSTLRSGLYLGRVTHRRVRDRAHALSYPAFYALFDLDELPGLTGFPWFGVNRRACLAWRDGDHGDGGGEPFRDWLSRRLCARGFEAQAWRYEVLCLPRVFGYVFNPITVVYAYSGGELKAMVYEVNNTFGQRVHYVLPAAADGRRVLRQHCGKTMHVSPFFDVAGGYVFDLSLPGQTVALSIRHEDEQGLRLHAAFTGRRLEWSASALRTVLRRFPLMTAKVVAGIHWEAFKLWRKGLRYYPNPHAGEVPPHG